MGFFNRSKTKTEEFIVMGDFIIKEFADIYRQGIFEIPVYRDDLITVTYEEDGYIENIVYNGDKLGENGFDMNMYTINMYCEKF